MKKTKLTQDHLRPISVGGETSVSNIAPACNECNQKKSSRPIWDMLNE